jgi:hypothetical protein
MSGSHFEAVQGQTRPARHGKKHRLFTCVSSQLFCPAFNPLTDLLSWRGDLKKIPRRQSSSPRL